MSTADTPLINSNIDDCFKAKKVTIIEYVISMISSNLDRWHPSVTLCNPTTLSLIFIFQLTEAECLLLKAKRKKMMDMVLSLTEREQALNKRSKTLTNEVLAEKISVEKLRIEGN
jgi:hypothetical protein